MRECLDSTQHHACHTVRTQEKAAAVVAFITVISHKVNRMTHTGVRIQDPKALLHAHIITLEPQNHPARSANKNLILAGEEGKNQQEQLITELEMQPTSPKSQNPSDSQSLSVLLVTLSAQDLHPSIQQIFIKSLLSIRYFSQPTAWYKACKMLAVMSLLSPGESGSRS